MHFPSRLLAGIFIVFVSTASALVLSAFIEGDASGKMIGGNPGLEGRNVSDVLSRLNLLPVGTRERSLFSLIIENHEDARPYHQGVEDALLVQEYPVEGFITRFLLTFDTANVPALLGPVRSLRPYFVDTILPWKTPILHAGGSPEAFERAESIAHFTAINGLELPKEFVRDDGIPAPHNLFIDRTDALMLVRNAGIANVRWPPYDTGGMQSNSGALSIYIDYRNPAHNTRYTHDVFSQGYIRENGITVSKAKPMNVLIMEIPIESIGEYGRLSIPLVGRGNALLFRGGTVERARWERKNLDEWFTFKTMEGDPLTFARGQTWMTVIPSLSQVEWANQYE